jgi:hypothetical protein
MPRAFHFTARDRGTVLHKERDSFQSSSNPERFGAAVTARVMLRLDAEIAAQRLASAQWLTIHDSPMPELPDKPDDVELAVLMALAHVYGPALLEDARFAPVIEQIAILGGVQFVQHVLWGRDGEEPDDADTLRDVRGPFDVLMLVYSNVFLAQARDVLEKVRARL